MTLKKACIIIIQLLTVYLSAVKANGKYIVIGPGTIHSNNKYTVAVSIHEAASPCKIKVGITGPSYNDSSLIELKSHNDWKHCEFNVPTLLNGVYNLTAEGIDCMDNFKNTTRLYWEKFNTHVRIQTDKGVYKPGDVINFRVIFLDKDLRPAKPEKDVVIWLENSDNNRIKEFRNIEVKKGVYTSKFQLSEHSATGSWRLGVHNGVHFDRHVYFDVEKYVLPKFIVKIEDIKSVSVKDGDMQVIVKANYTYGKPLNGKVTLLLMLDSHYYLNYYNEDNSNENLKSPTIIKTGEMVAGKAKIDVNVKIFEAYMTHKTSTSSLVILATVEEVFTGIQINATTYANIYPYRYSMYCISYQTCSSFQADKEATIELKLSLVDDTHLNDTHSPIKLIFTEILRKYHFLSRYKETNNNETMDKEPISLNRTFEFTSHMNETGFVIFKVVLPGLEEYKDHSHYYTMEMEYRDERRELYNTYQYREPKQIEPPAKKYEINDEKSKNFFKIQYQFPRNNIEVNKETKFLINSSCPLTYINYHVIGRGNIIESNQIKLENAKLYNLTLTPKFIWMPHFSLYVYYVDNKGDYYYAERNYYIKYQLENQINITAPEKVKPGDEVDLKIITEPDSFIGLMAVDQSVLLMRSNNDLYSHDFNWLLSLHTTRTPPQGGYSNYPGSISGVVTLTNANYFYNWTQPEYISSTERVFFDNDGVLYKTHVQAATSPEADVIAHDISSSESDVSTHVRQDFSEVWIFDDIYNNNNTELIWSKKIPDTITSWIITGFSMHNDKGLGITSHKTKVVTFQPFFISVRLPYSIKRGEVINVPALVFNYLSKDLDVNIKLDNSDGEYELLDITNEVLNDQQQIMKSIRVPAGSAVGVSFLLLPKIVGNIMLKFNAISPVAADSVHKTLKVVPEGVTHYINNAKLINLSNEQPEAKISVELELPENIIPDSEYIHVGIIGNILGPVLNNLDNLIRKPSGCGEQTMSKLVPNYLIMKYLKLINKLTPDLETKLRYNMDVGYQNMLNFRHPDGSFSAFGLTKHDDNKTINGSTWLTAFVIQSLQNLNEFIDIDQNIIDSGKRYLITMQVDNGSFLDKGDYFYAANCEPIILTSTVLLALAEKEKNPETYAKMIKTGLDFVAQHLHDEKTSIRAQAVGTYTLNKLKHAQSVPALEKLVNFAKIKNNYKWWSVKDEDVDTNRWYRFSNNYAIETTSYVLLTLLNQPQILIEEILPIIQWLVAQRNSYGGFLSSQDTIVGLMALLRFAQYSNYQAAEMNVEIITDNAQSNRNILHLTQDNGLLFQELELSKKTKNVNCIANGTGTALVQISYEYNLKDDNYKQSFKIQTKKYTNKMPGKLLIHICVEYIGDGKASNMAILEISLPSGFIVDEEVFTDIQEISGVSNIEIQNVGSKLVIYFDHLYKTIEKCVPVEALRSHAVSLQKPASIVLYDYYDNTRKTISYYEIESKLCDICDDIDECNKCK